MIGARIGFRRSGRLAVGFVNVVLLYFPFAWNLLNQVDVPGA